MKLDLNQKPTFKLKTEEVTAKPIEQTSTVNNPFASKECIDILNLRILNEEQSSRLYQSMSLWLNDNGFKGAAKKWLSDSKDEMEHAQWAKDFLLDMGVQPKLPALQEPAQTFQGLPDIIRKSYDHEILITTQCNDLAKHAMQYGNHLLYQLAIKYLQEQQEELGKLQDALDMLSAFGETKDVLFMLDKQFGE
jgi:ferritin